MPPPYTLRTATDGSTLVQGPKVYLPFPYQPGHILATQILEALNAAYQAGVDANASRYTPAVSSAPGRRVKNALTSEQERNEIASKVLLVLSDNGGYASTRSIVRALKIAPPRVMASIQVLEITGKIAREMYGSKPSGWRLSTVEPRTHEPSERARNDASQGLVQRRAEEILRILAPLEYLSGNQLRAKVTGGSACVRAAFRALEQAGAIERHIIDGVNRGWRATAAGRAAVALETETRAAIVTALDDVGPDKDALEEALKTEVRVREVSMTQCDVTAYDVTVRYPPDPPQVLQAPETLARQYLTEIAVQPINEQDQAKAAALALHRARANRAATLLPQVPATEGAFSRLSRGLPAVLPTVPAAPPTGSFAKLVAGPTVAEAPAHSAPSSVAAKPSVAKPGSLANIARADWKPTAITPEAMQRVRERFDAENTGPYSRDNPHPPIVKGQYATLDDLPALYRRITDEELAMFPPPWSAKKPITDDQLRAALDAVAEDMDLDPGEGLLPSWIHLETFTKRLRAKLIVEPRAPVHVEIMPNGYVWAQVHNDGGGGPEATWPVNADECYLNRRQGDADAAWGD